MTDITSAFGLSAKPAVCVAAMPRVAPTRALSVAALNATVAVLIVSLGVGWPGAVVLTLIFLVAAHAAVIATVEFHTALTKADRGARWWLLLLGATALIGGSLSLTSLNGAAAIVPVIAGAWFAARARTGLLFASGAASLGLGLMVLTAFGAHHAAPIAFLGVQAASTGATMLAVSLPALHGRPVEGRARSRQLL